MRTFYACFQLLFLAISMEKTVLARPPQDKASTAKEASEAYEAKDWPKASRLYQEIAAREPGNPRTWYRLGTALHGLGNDEKAVAAYKTALDAGMPPALGEYQLGLVYAAMREKEKSFEYLKRAAEHGFSQSERLEADEELAALRGDARFAGLTEEVKRNQKPCAYSAENRQFDFWLGEWSVVATQGETPAGTSKIELVLGDCVVQENWTSSGNLGYTGKSYNIYNQSLKRWEQYWVDSAGGNIFFYGGLKDGVMDYWTDAIPQTDGTKLKRHLQFFKLGPDKVRQFSQGSTDDGKTWHVEYDLTYNRRK